MVLNYNLVAQFSFFVLMDKEQLDSA